MTDDERLRHLLRSAFPAVADETLARDLWPRAAAESRRIERWPWLDFVLAAAAISALALLPGSLSLLAYHL